MKYTHTHTHIYTQEYYSAMKRKEILSLETTRMDLESIILSETNVIETKNNKVVARSWEVEEIRSW